MAAQVTTAAVPGQLTDLPGTATSAVSTAHSASWAKVVLAGVVVAALTAGAWWTADRWYARDARQQAADRWALLRRCVLGSGLTADERPGKRLTRIALATGGAPADDPASWPQRCLAHAQALDDALARPALRGRFRELPLATAIVAADTPLAERAAAIDALWRGLRAADLPLPSSPAVDEKATPMLPPPKPATPVLRLREWRPLAGDHGGALLDRRFDSSHSRELRLLFDVPGGPPLLCTVHDGGGKRLGTAGCRPLGWSPPKHVAETRLARSDAGAPSLVYARTGRRADGFYDPASGQRIWRPRFADAQGFVRRSGATAILYGVPTEEAARDRGGPPLVMGSTTIDHFRLVRLEPGRAPTNRRLDVPPDARLLLLGTQLLWWHPADAADELFVGRLEDGEARPRSVRRLGALPRGSRLTEECRAERATALLFQSPRHDTSPVPSQLVWLGEQGDAQVYDLGALPQPASLACDDDAASVAARRGDLVIRTWRCSSSACEESSTAAMPWIARSAERLTSHTLGRRLLLVWTTPSTGLRLRIAEPGKLAQARDRLLLDPGDVARLQPQSLQLLSARGAAVLLIRSASGGLYALRIPPTGNAIPLVASR